MATYTHPQTGDTVEIPEDAEVVRVGDLPAHERAEGAAGDEIVYWRMAPEGDQNADNDYQYMVSPTGPERRLLAFITDEVDEEFYGPRNSVRALARALSKDADSPFVAVTREMLADQGQGSAGLVTADSQVEEFAGKLHEAGLIDVSEDGTYALTEDGREELRH